MASTYTPIATTTLSSAANSVTFSSISGSYTDLVVVSDISYSSLGANVGYVLLQVGNGSVDTATNYSVTYVQGNGSSATSGKESTRSYINLETNVTSSNRVIITNNLQNYANTTTYKTILTRTNDAAFATSASVGLWRSTSAINTIKIYDYSGYNFAIGSTFTLYGILAA